MLYETNRAEDIAQLVEYLLSMHEVLGLNLTLNEPGLVANDGAPALGGWRQ